MKFRPFRLPILIAALLAIVAGCASLPARQKAVQSTQAVDLALSKFQDAEWQACNGTAYLAFVNAGRAIDRAVTTCAGPEAEALRLTTEKHQAINKQLASAFATQRKIVLVLQNWQVGQPTPAELPDLMTQSRSFLELVKTLAATDQQKQLVSLGETVLVEIQKIVDALRGGA